MRQAERGEEIPDLRQVQRQRGHLVEPVRLLVGDEGVPDGVEPLALRFVHEDKLGADGRRLRLRVQIGQEEGGEIVGCFWIAPLGDSVLGLPYTRFN